MKKKAIIVSFKSYILSENEKKILKYKPWGVILFKRNIKSLDQLKKLIISIKKISKDKNLPIIIDEEGGAVSRLKNLIRFDLTQRSFGEIYKIDQILAKNIYKNYIYGLCKELKTIGININTLPVLDVVRKYTHNIISNRSFSDDPKVVKILGNLCVKYFKQNKMGSVIKHIPGHGCSIFDSHLKLPKVALSKKELNKIDFYPFKSSKSKFAMTAHILYSKIDNKNVATFSKKIISKIIRKRLNFKGILISDDISMKALKYDLVKNAKTALLAGCNLVLYCAGKYHESSKLISEVPYIDNFTIKKTSEFYKFLR
tara:strand:+ start:1398 stop:2339 length:942 start_codon:yes stop_codon:yes gene_type:complete